MDESRIGDLSSPEGPVRSPSELSSVSQSAEAESDGDREGSPVFDGHKNHDSDVMSSPLDTAAATVFSRSPSEAGLSEAAVPRGAEQGAPSGSLTAATHACVPKLELDNLAGGAGVRTSSSSSSLSGASTWRRPTTAPRALYLQPPSRCKASFQDYRLQEREQTPRSATLRRPATGYDALMVSDADLGATADAATTEREGTGTSVSRLVRRAVALSRKPRVLEEALGEMQCRYADEHQPLLPQLWSKSSLHTLSGVASGVGEVARHLREHQRVVISTFYDGSQSSKVRGGKGLQRGRNLLAIIFEKFAGAHQAPSRNTAAGAARYTLDQKLHEDRSISSSEFALLVRCLLAESDAGRLELNLLSGVEDTISHPPKLFGRGRGGDSER
jgi:hypothetical protein